MRHSSTSPSRPIRRIAVAVLIGILLAAPVLAAPRAEVGARPDNVAELVHGVGCALASWCQMGIYGMVVGGGTCGLYIPFIDFPIEIFF